MKTHMLLFNTLSRKKEEFQPITAGQVKLRNGSPLNIDNTVQPANNPNPHPTEG